MRSLICLMCLFSVVFSESFSANFKQTPLSKFIEITSKIAEKRILVPYEIKGMVNLSSYKHLTGKELMSMLKASLAANGYKLEAKNDFYEVSKIKNKPKPNKLEVIEVLNSDAKELVKNITALVNLKQRNIKISVLKSTNAIVIAAKNEDLIYLKQLISTLDEKPKQVYVKARILEVNESKVNNIGIEYGLLGGQSNNGDILAFSSKLNGVNSGAMPFDLSSIGLEIPSVTSALALGASINLLKKNQALNIVSEPSILCLNNATSSIYVGETKSIKNATTVTDTLVKELFEREDIGLLLNVKPRISSNGKVQLFIHAILENVSTTSMTNEQPDTFKKEIKTTAVVQNGESVIIGGLIENRSEELNNDVPFLSKVPLVGALFKNTKENTEQKNLMIIITPYLIPSSQGLTYVNEELTRLGLLEEYFLQNKLKFLTAKKNKKNNKKNSNISSEAKLQRFLQNQ